VILLSANATKGVKASADALTMNKLPLSGVPKVHKPATMHKNALNAM